MSVQYTGGVQYNGGCSVHQGDIMSTLGGYHEYTGRISWVRWGCSVHWADIMSTLGWYHDKCGEGHCKNNWICMETPLYWTSPGVLMISPTLIMLSPWCTEQPHAVLMIFPQTHHGIPHCTEHPLVYSMISPWCTEHLPVYCTPPGLLHRHYAGWDSCWRLLPGTKACLFTIFSSVS